MESISAEVQQMMFGVLALSAGFALVNYFITGLALYNVSKTENVDKAWLSWIPIGNFYQLIKLGKGNYIFIIAMIGVMLFSQGTNIVTLILGIVSSVLYSVYSVRMYYNICDKYNINVIFIAIGMLSPICVLVKSLGGLLIPVLLIGLYGQFKLAMAAKKPVEEKGRKIETRVISSKKKKK